MLFLKTVIFLGVYIQIWVFSEKNNWFSFWMYIKTIYSWCCVFSTLYCIYFRDISTHVWKPLVSCEAVLKKSKTKLTRERHKVTKCCRKRSSGAKRNSTADSSDSLDGGVRRCSSGPLFQTQDSQDDVTSQANSLKPAKLLSSPSMEPVWQTT